MFNIDMLSKHNHEKIKDEEMPGMHIVINVVESCMTYQTPDCMRVEELRMTLEDKYVIALAELVLCGWPSIETKVQKDLQPHWSVRDKKS